MEQKPGGGLQMSAVMSDEDHDWLDNFAKIAKQSTAEAEERQRKKEARDHAFFVKLRADQARMDREYAPKAEKVWKNLQWRPDEEPISDEKWKRIVRKASKPAMWPELTSISRIKVEEEAEAAPTLIDQGVLGFGILGSIRKIFWQEIEQKNKRREADRILNRAAIF